MICSFKKLCIQIDTHLDLLQLRIYQKFVFLIEILFLWSHLKTRFKFECVCVSLRLPVCALIRYANIFIKSLNMFMHKTMPRRVQNLDRHKSVCLSVCPDVFGCQYWKSFLLSPIRFWMPIVLSLSPLAVSSIWSCNQPLLLLPLLLHKYAYFLSIEWKIYENP